MSVSKMPNGRWRAQLKDPATGKRVTAASVIGGLDSYRTKTQARVAEFDARRLLGDVDGDPQVTVGEFHYRWTTDPLFARPKESTNRHNAERTRAFRDQHADLPLRRVDDRVVAQWLAGGKRNGQVPSLRAMFFDAASPKAGRLIDVNPWAKLGLKQSRGNRDEQPPDEDMVWSLIRNARHLGGLDFACWLQVAAFSGLRPGELDGLPWCNVDLRSGELQVRQQWSVGSRKITTPKTPASIRPVPITPPARDALMMLPRDREFVFANLRGGNMTPSSRAYHWKATKAASGWDRSLYLATRHFAGWYMVNVLEQDSEDVAIILGHDDGGEQVRRRYGHREKRLARDRVAAAYAAQGNVRPLRPGTNLHTDAQESAV